MKRWNIVVALLVLAGFVAVPAYAEMRLSVTGFIDNHVRYLQNLSAFDDDVTNGTVIGGVDVEIPFDPQLILSVYFANRNYTGNDTYIGTALDVWLRYTLFKHADLDLYFAYIFAGDALDYAALAPVLARVLPVHGPVPRTSPPQELACCTGSKAISENNVTYGAG